MVVDKKKIAISLVNRDNLNILKLCLDSLIASDISQHDITLYYWDNASDSPVLEYINSLDIKKIAFIVTKNYGIVLPRINLGTAIIKEDFDYLLEIHADMIFPKVWFNSLVDGLSDPMVAVNMPFILTSSYRGNPYPTIEQINNLVDLHKENKEVYTCLQVHPWLLSVPCLRKIGYYRTEFIDLICEDDDFMFRTIKSGFKIRATKSSIVYHYGGYSGGSILNDQNKSFTRFFELNGLVVQDHTSILKNTGGHPVIYF